MLRQQPCPQCSGSGTIGGPRMGFQNEVERFVEVYLAMSPFYRPGAPSDGFGHITVPLAELDLDAEALEWARRKSCEVSEGWFYIGITDFTMNKGLLYALEIARMCCSADVASAKKLLKLLTEEVAAWKVRSIW